MGLQMYDGTDQTTGGIRLDTDMAGGAYQLAGSLKAVLSNTQYARLANSAGAATHVMGYRGFKL